MVCQPVAYPGLRESPNSSFDENHHGFAPWPYRYDYFPGALSLSEVGQYFLHEPPELGFLFPGRDAKQDVGGPDIHEGL